MNPNSTLFKKGIIEYPILYGVMVLKNISVSELASFMKKSPHTIRSWIRGDYIPSEIDISRIEKLLGVKARYLFRKYDLKQLNPDYEREDFRDCNHHRTRVNYDEVSHVILYAVMYCSGHTTSSLAEYIGLSYDQISGYMYRNRNPFNIRNVNLRVEVLDKLKSAFNVSPYFLMLEKSEIEKRA